jgi:hypothetical protein
MAKKKSSYAKKASELQFKTDKTDELKRIFKKFEKYKLSPEAMKEYKKAAKAIKKVPKASIAKRVLGKTLSKAIPGVGAAIIARDVVKGISKSTCSKRGGKWVDGKCKGAKKTKFKSGAKVKDPISKR